jgi:hypothetical protein
LAALRVLRVAHGSGAHASLRATVALASSLAMAAATFIALTPATAAAKDTHVLRGTLAAGELAQPQSIAVDQVTGNIYVADFPAGNASSGVVRKFDSSGSPSNFSALGSNALGPFTFAGPGDIAVDNSAGVNAGNIYIATEGQAIRAFKPSGQPANFSASAEYISGNSLTGVPGEPYGFAGHVTVDQNGDIYVAENFGHFGLPAAVDIYAPTGQFLTQFHPHEGPGEGARDLAVSSEGDVFLSTGSGSDPKISEFTPTSFPVTSSTQYGAPTTVYSGSEQGLAINSADDLYAYAAGQQKLVEFNPAGNQISEFGNLGDERISGEAHGLAVGGSGSSERIYITVSAGRFERKVEVFGALVTIPDATTGAAGPVANTTATITGVINPAETVASYQFEYGTTSSYGQKAPASPAAVGSDNLDHPESAELSGLQPSTTYHYRIDGINECEAATECVNPGKDATFRTTGPPTIVESSAAPSGSVATVHSTINPSGFDTSYEVEYGPTAAYGSHSQAVDLGSSGLDQQTSVELTGLQPETTYHYRILAANHCNSAEPAEKCTVTSGDATFETTAPLLIDSTTFTDVTTTEAVLEAGINPEGSTTTYHFEYGPTEAYGSSTEPAEIGPSLVDRQVSAQVTNLQPGTEYHFRLVAGDSFTESHGGPIHGADRVFVTVFAGSAFSNCPNELLRQENTSIALSDCRAYEQVSPPGNAEVFAPETGPTSNNQGYAMSPFPVQSSSNGEAVTYVGEPPSSGQGEGTGNAGGGEGDEFLATRGGAGWSASDIQPLASEPTTAYQTLSGDLSVGILHSTIGEPLGPGVDAKCPLLYSRAIPAGSFRPLFEGGPKGCTSEHPPAFVGATADHSGLVFESKAALVAGAKASSGGVGHENIYESFGGQLYLVNVLPGSKPKADPDATVGSLADEGTLQTGGGSLPAVGASNVVSADGSRVFWTDLATGIVYVRENAIQEPSAVEAGQCIEPAQACTLQVSAGAATYQTATSDGHYAYYTEGGQLWRFDIQTDTREALAGAGAGVQGVIGVNETGPDGSYLYFVAAAGLSPGAEARKCESAQHGGTAQEKKEEAEGSAPPGRGCNLYLLHEGATILVAVLLAGDNEFEAGNVNFSSAVKGDWRPVLGYHAAQLTPSGHRLVFMSERRLTSYDNLAKNDVCSPIGQGGNQPTHSCAEIYLYDAEADPQAAISCVSCNPTGTPPVKSLNEAREGRTTYLPGNFSAPGLTHMRRWISADGRRVFFDTDQPLSPADTNGLQDVYEWEQQGTGSCGKGSPFNNGGCLYLLSSAAPTSASTLVDSSINGADAFFITRAALAASDGDEKPDLYDARVEGGFPAPARSIPCEAESCKEPLAAPPASQSPGSSTFSSPGNEPGKAPCGKGAVRKRGKCVPKKHTNKRNGHKRAGHNRGGQK